MNFIEQLQSQVGPQVAQQLTNRFGIDPEKAQDILPKMAPFVLGGLHSQMQGPDDADSAGAVLNNHGDENAYDDVDGHFDRADQQEQDPQSVLGGLFGQHSTAASTTMANQLGISTDMLAKILPVIAPIILGAVMKKVKGASQEAPDADGPQRDGGMDILSSILGQSGASGGLGSILGSVLGGAGGSGAAGQGGGLANKAGCLSMVLGMLGGKK